MDDQKQTEPHPLDIPDFLVRDPVTNTAEFMMSEQAQEIMKERAKPKARPAKTETKPVKTKPAKETKAKAPAKVEVKAKPKKAEPAKKAVKAATSKKADKSEKDQFGLRKGSTRSTAAAMYARKSGATLEEVKEAVGSIQLNVLKELEANGFAVEKEKENREGKRPLTRYWLKAAK
jgi:outer membrane biosynthesis protein TonB